LSILAGLLKIDKLIYSFLTNYCWLH